MTEYLVELYVPNTSASGAAGARTAEAAARDLWDEGVSVQYVRSIVIPGDETCFHVFEASSMGAVEEVARRAGIRFERIVPVTEVNAGGSPGRGPGGRRGTSAGVPSGSSPKLTRRGFR